MATDFNLPLFEAHTSSSRSVSGSTTPRSSGSSAAPSTPSTPPSTPGLVELDSFDFLHSDFANALSHSTPWLGTPKDVPPTPRTSLVHELLGLPAQALAMAAESGAANAENRRPSQQLAAQLLAHDRVLSTAEPLLPGSYDLSGLGWEAYARPLEHVTVDVAPGTQPSVHVLLHPPATQMALPQLMLATVAVWAAALAHLLLAVVGQNKPASSEATMGAAGVQLGCDETVRAHSVALRFSKPVWAYPAGWDARLLRVEFDGATIDAQGAMVPQGRLRLLNLIPLPGVGLAKHILPAFNVDADSIARDGLFQLAADKANKPKKVLNGDELSPGAIRAARIMGFIQDVLPDTLHVAASGPKGQRPITFTVPLGALGSAEHIDVELAPNAAQWQLELDTQKLDAPAARLYAAVSATLHHGDKQAQLQVALGATTAPERWPLKQPVPNLAEACLPQEPRAPLPQAKSTLGRMVHKLAHGPEIEAQLLVGTRLPGEEGFEATLGSTHIGRRKVDEQHTRYRVVQSTPDAARVVAFAQALDLQVPGLTEVVERITDFEAQLTLAR